MIKLTSGMPWFYIKNPSCYSIKLGNQGIFGIVLNSSLDLHLISGEPSLTLSQILLKMNFKLVLK
jgi:hypothetical protein